MISLEQLRLRRQEIASIARRYKALNVRVFGSVLHGTTHSRSDLDLLVEFAPEAGFLDFTGLLEELTDLLGIPVDLVPEERLKPEFRAQVLGEARQL